MLNFVLNIISKTQKRSCYFLLLVFPMVLLATPQQTPKDVLQQFYQAVNTQNCESAISLRPNYSLERCQRISEVAVHESDTVFNNGSDAVILLSIDIYTANAKSYFSGFVRLKNDPESWQIIGPYKSQTHYTLAEYVNDYVPIKSENSVENGSEKLTEVQAVPPSVDESIDPELNKYLSGEQAISGNYASLLNDLRSRLPELQHEQTLLIDRSRQSIYIYDKNNLLLGFFPILSTLSTDQIPNGLFKLENETTPEGKQNAAVHLIQIHSIDQTGDTTDASYYIRDLLDSDTDHSILLSPIDLSKLSTLLLGSSIIYIGD